MITIEKLQEFGANTEEGLTRCMKNEALYLRLVATAPNEKNFDKLRTALHAGDLDGAFEAAHALKGVLGNLSLTPLYEKAVEITELLRAKTEMDYSPLEDELFLLKNRLKDLCESD